LGLPFTLLEFVMPVRPTPLLACLLLPLLAATPSAPVAPPLTDAGILAIFDQVNGFDIETARMGVIRGHSEAVRSLAADVLRDHSMVQQMARDLASHAMIAYRVPTGDESERAHAAAMKELGGLSGSAFDAAYLKHEIAFHDGAIHAVREVLLPAATSPELKTLLNTVLPGFEHHLEMTREAARQAR
jgi:putative membrane protein